LAMASRISGRSAWFSIVRGSDCESASTWPFAAMTVTRTLLAHLADPLVKAARSSGLVEGTETTEEAGLPQVALRTRVVHRWFGCTRRERARSAKKSTATSTLKSSARNVKASFQKRLCRTSFEQVPGAADGLKWTGFSDRLRSFRVSGGRTRPRCAE